MGANLLPEGAFCELFHLNRHVLPEISTDPRERSPSRKSILKTRVFNHSEVYPIPLLLYMHYLDRYYRIMSVSFFLRIYHQAIPKKQNRLECESHSRRFLYSYRTETIPKPHFNFQAVASLGFSPIRQDDYNPTIIHALFFQKRRIIIHKNASPQSIWIIFHAGNPIINGKNDLFIEKTCEWRFVFI